MGVEQWASPLLDQGRYHELSSRAEAVPPNSPDYPAARYWIVRCLMEQGHVHAASEAIRGLPESVLTSGATGAQLRLWSGFLKLYEQQDRAAETAFDEYEQVCRGFVESDEHAVVRAWAADLGARAQAMRFVLAGQGAEQRERVMARIAATADAYRAAGAGQDAVGALRRAASFGSDGRAAERAVSRELLRKARDEAQEQGFPVAAAEARLALAEFDLRDLLDGREDLQEAEVLAEFDRLVEAFSETGHAFGEAKVRWAVARWLLLYGLVAGVDMARASAQEFAEAEALSSEQIVWAALDAWHTAHGDPEASGEAREQQNRLASVMGFGLAADVRALGEANTAFRSGDVARATPLLTGDPSSTSAGLLAGRRVMMATSAIAVGLTREARALLNGVIEDLERTGASVVLGEALTVLATSLVGEDPERAARLLSRAIEVARETEAATEEGQYLGQRAWGRVVHRHATRAAPLVDDEALADFDEAQRVLLTQRTLAARAELVTLNQYRGQAAFFAADWDGCGDWFTQAEQIARQFGLLPQLAAILCHQGLALIQRGRQTGPVTYDHAAGRLDESRQLYEQVGLRPFNWKLLFFRALCDIEAARWPRASSDASSVEPAERLKRASALMESASQEIDWLRQASEQGGAERRQEVWMAFSIDKQTFYEQGFQLAWDARADADEAWVWLERSRGRALLDALSNPDTPSPTAELPSPEARHSAAAQSQPMSFIELSTRLAAEQSAHGRRLVVAQYLCTPTRTVLFIARADQPSPQVAYIPLDHAALRSFAASYFRTPGGVRMMQEDLADGGKAAWHRFAPLLAPLATWSDPGDVIYLVPHGILHDLPLHTLPLDGMPLIERNPVCYLPAAAVLRHTLDDSRIQLSDHPPAVFGDSRDNLASARSEAIAVADLFDVTAELGADVDRPRVLAALADSPLVHIAGHGKVSVTDGFDSHMELAAGQVLRAADLLGQRSRARLVVLSGCETGVSEQRSGEELVGFTRSLLLSGVPSILASQWRVNDASSRDLLSRFHTAARDPRLPLADALRLAILDIRDRAGYDHLYHWGGFTLVGSWR